MLLKNLTYFFLIHSFVWATSPAICIAETDLKSTLQNMEGTMDSIKTVGVLPVKCEANNSVMTLSKVNTSETECQKRLGAASIKVMNCMEVYLKSLNSSKTSPVACNGMAKLSPDELAAQQKIMAEALTKVLAKFDNGNPEAVLAKLNPAERKLFDMFLQSIKNQDEADKLLARDEQKKKDDAARKIKELDELKSLGFDLLPSSDTANVKVEFNQDKFNPEILKNSKASVYTAIEHLYGKEIALNMQKMYSDLPQTMKTGIVAVFFDDHVMIPNTENGISHPKVISKKEFDNLETEHFKNYMNLADRCFRLSEQYGSSVHTLGQIAKNYLPALVNLDSIDEVEVEKLECENKMSQEVYYLSATLGLAKDKMAQILTQAREAARINGQNIDKTMSTLAAFAKAQQGVLVASGIIFTGGTIAIVGGSAVLTTAIYAGLNVAAGSAVFNMATSSVQAVVSPKGLACYHINLGEVMFSRMSSYLSSLPLLISVGMALPYAGSMLGTGAISGLAKLSYFANKPALLAKAYKALSVVPDSLLYLKMTVDGSKAIYSGSKKAQENFSKSKKSKKDGFKEAADLEKREGHQDAVNTGVQGATTIYFIDGGVKTVKEKSK